ncbi:putative DHHC domain protein [Gregarina niphandrodes]|uniref:Palmitoyltransferase n=1 Tax=Gregarina niphandrodes TaxID=110365 RepID=A0A023BCU9_GRENI|nr:putative DHHC domain protein [Gregarina niphandrodes]EZG86310.1 putative DHHC domain protein [Gregarina niphandrodes]|eukprot:XP_011128761.1 putative DHHC domain protein [Gregarina niphandrodes]
MDHHCPWINNCVGFYNRKFFIQTLIYANVCLIILIVHSIVHLTDAALEFNHYQIAGPIDYVDWGCGIAMITFTAVLLAGLIPFTRFHWHLLVVNSTTIETMDVANRTEDSRYDLGALRNIQQVFGVTSWLWWLPMHVYLSCPQGDGVRWRRHYLATGTESV